MTTPEERLARLGLVLPDVPRPVANFVPFRLVGPWLYLSGQVPDGPNGLHVGKLGADVAVEEGYQHAKICALKLIAVAKAAVGELSRLSVVKVLGMVNAVPDFTDHPRVVNGASDLFVDVFGENGHHARSAVGMGSLPSRVSVEVEAIFYAG